MHTSYIKLKNGELWSGVVWGYEPEKDLVTLSCAQSKGSDKEWASMRFKFSDMEEFYTPNERISINKIGTDDILARAREDMKRHNATEFGWEK